MMGEYPITETIQKVTERERDMPKSRRHHRSNGLSRALTVSVARPL